MTSKPECSPLVFDLSNQAITPGWSVVMEARTGGGRPPYTGDACPLFIEKILAAHLIECAEGVRPARNNFFRSNSSQYLLDGIRISHQAAKFGRVKFLRIKPLENLGNFQSQAHGARRETIGNPNPHPGATLTAVRAADRNKGLRHKTHTGKMTLVQRGRYVVAIHPWRSKLFEGRLRAPANGYAGILQDFNSRIKNGTLRRTERW